MNYEVNLFEGDPNLKFEVVYGNINPANATQMLWEASRATRHPDSSPKTSACRYRYIADKRLAHLRDTALRKSVANANAYCDSDGHGNPTATASATPTATARPSPTPRIAPTPRPRPTPPPRP